VLELLHKGDLTDGGRGGALLRVEVDFLERDEFARLTVAALEDLNRRETVSVRLLENVMGRRARGSSLASGFGGCFGHTDRGIGALTELLQLLERAGVSFAVHCV
jgi:hypothetical protein